jgi:hypothetical protein
MTIIERTGRRRCCREGELRKEIHKEMRTGSKVD